MTTTTMATMALVYKSSSRDIILYCCWNYSSYRRAVAVLEKNAATLLRIRFGWWLLLLLVIDRLEIREWLGLLIRVLSLLLLLLLLLLRLRLSL